MPTLSNVIANPGFEEGDTLWTKGTGWEIDDDFSPYEGSFAARIDTDASGTVTSEILNENVVQVEEGVSITATCRALGLGADGNIAAVLIDWLDGGFSRVAVSKGNYSSNGSPNTWEVSTVTATAPAGAVYARVGAEGKAVTNGAVKVDSFTWSYVNDRTVTLESPEDGAEYTFGDTVQLRVDIDGTSPAVDHVEYFSGVSLIATTDDSPYSYNISTLAVGVHDITAEVTFVGGSTITTDINQITINAVEDPPDTREFKASNSYTYLVGSNFHGLGSAIPSTAIITGVELVVDYKLDVLVRSKDLDITDPAGANDNVLFDIVESGLLEAVLLTNDGGTYTAGSAPITGSIPVVRTDFDIDETGISEGKKWIVFEGSTQQVTLGGETALFGQSPIATADFLERSIGLRFFPVLQSKPDYADSGDACIRFYIDALRLRVYFDAGSAEYYFANADKTEILRGVLIAANTTDGNFRTGDAEGVLQLHHYLELWDDVESEWVDGSTHAIEEDWTIHAAFPPTDANQIGTVAERDALDGGGMAYNGLPTAEAIVENRSRYEFITANFYAVDSLDSIYGVHGLPRAFAYNGDFFYKIFTQADPDKDQPRHVAYHHGHLALGFPDGRVDISVVGEPYNFDGDEGATEISIGDKITGLLPLSGTILGIFGSKSVWGMSGTTTDNFSTQVISPNIGAIEYTVTDMGFPVYANAYGVYTLSQTQQYGDYLGTPMSQDISPWLRPRLIRSYTSDKEVVVAWPVRSKNQYRLAFSDGYVMSMTLNAGSQSAPTFSFQQYTIYSEADE